MARTILTQCVHGNFGRDVIKYTVIYDVCRVARTIYIRCVNSIFGREFTTYTVIYGAFIQFWFWPALRIHVCTVELFSWFF